MKHLQYFQQGKPESIDVPVYVPGYENKSHDGNALRKYKQTATGSESSTRNQNVADRIRNYCLYILMFVLTGHAVVARIKSSYEKNVLATKEGLKILRVIFLAGRNMTPALQQKIQSIIAAFVNHVSYGDLPERLLTQFKSVAPDLYTQIDTASVNSEAVVSALWPCTFSLWLHL